jgi:2-oxoglutarate ferredoxin oxidoreductase subunit gamma
LLLVNSSLVGKKSCRTSRLLQYPFTEIAVNLGNVRVANMVALGSYLAVKATVGEESVLETMREMAPAGRQELVEINQKALSRGKELIGGSIK